MILNPDRFTLSMSADAIGLHAKRGCLLVKFNSTLSSFICLFWNVLSSYFWTLRALLIHSFCDKLQHAASFPSHVYPHDNRHFQNHSILSPHFSFFTFNSIARTKECLVSTSNYSVWIFKQEISCPRDGTCYQSLHAVHSYSTRYMAHLCSCVSLLIYLIEIWRF